MDDAAGRDQTDSSTRPPQDDEPSLSSIRRILFAAEVDRIDQLEQEKARLESEIAALQERLAALGDDMAAAEAHLRQQTAELADDIDDIIARKAEAAPEDMAEALGPVMAGALRVQDRRGREDLVDAVSPVLSEAIENQIRDSRQSMIEALFPIIGEVVQRYVGEFFRELQRNIDARLRHTLTPQRAARRATARLSGVSAAELELRDALPFSIREVFLIQSGSGLLLARAGSDEAVDSDLISGMLTAVRSFVHDSFSQPEGAEPLDEIQHGEQRILIQDGRLCYLAVVIHGYEPTGFRAEMRRFLSRLHSDHYKTLENFSGDMAEMDEIALTVDRLPAALTALAPETAGPKPLTRGQKAVLALGGIGGLLLLATACFYLQFTLALLPVAFGRPTPTHTATPPPTATHAPTETAAPTTTAAATATVTASPTPTTPPSATPTTPPTATATTAIVPFTIITNRPVWAFTEPSLQSPQAGAIELGEPVDVITFADPWLLVEWQTPLGRQQGWISIRWVDFAGTPPPDLPVTPRP